VFGIIGVLGGWRMFGVPCLIAVVTGHAALKETRTGQRGGHGMAVAGLILGYPFALWIWWRSWAAASSFSTCCSSDLDPSARS
jgi:hypothetical protein